MMDRNEVYRLIDGERDYQEAQYGTLEQQKRSLYDWIGSIRHYNNKALHADIKGKGDTGTLHALRKVAALAVAALEQYGCEPREAAQASKAEGVSNGNTN
jgi:hypothetical protein